MVNIIYNVESKISGGGFTAEACGDKNEKLPCAMSRPVLSNMQGNPENIQFRGKFKHPSISGGFYHWVSF